MKDYFYVDELTKERVTISINYKNVPITRIECGTAFKTAALLFNLTYPDFLRMARDLYGGSISGKNCKYPMLRFDSKDQAEKLTKELNTRMTEVMKKWEEKFNGGKTYIGRR